MKRQPERGAASIKITLADGKIKVTHGGNGETLLHTGMVEEGSWNKLWSFLESLGEQ
jgi:hypothetical protein